MPRQTSLVPYTSSGLCGTRARIGKTRPRACLFRVCVEELLPAREHVRLGRDRTLAVRRRPARIKSVDAARRTRLTRGADRPRQRFSAVGRLSAGQRNRAGRLTDACVSRANGSGARGVAYVHDRHLLLLVVQRRVPHHHPRAAAANVPPHVYTEYACVHRRERDTKDQGRRRNAVLSLYTCQIRKVWVASRCFMVSV
jgi:hypothetical protein